VTLEPLVLDIVAYMEHVPEVTLRSWQREACCLSRTNKPQMEEQVDNTSLDKKTW